jgi:L-lactate dehydrogenase complex protein LldE
MAHPAESIERCLATAERRGRLRPLGPRPLALHRGGHAGPAESRSRWRFSTRAGDGIVSSVAQRGSPSSCPATSTCSVPRWGSPRSPSSSRHGARVEYPRAQTCCGQPMAKHGSSRRTRRGSRAASSRSSRATTTSSHASGAASRWLRRHYRDVIPDEAGSRGARRSHLRAVRVLDRRPRRRRDAGSLSATASSSTRAATGSASSASHAASERHETARTRCEVSSPRSRGSSWCGRRARTSAVGSAAPSPWTRSRSRPWMGRDRLDDFERAGAEIVTATDSSCLAHLEWSSSGATGDCSASCTSPRSSRPRRTPDEPRRSRGRSSSPTSRGRTGTTRPSGWSARSAIARAGRSRTGRASAARRRDQAECSLAARRPARGVRAQRGRARRGGPLGARRRGAQPDRPRAARAARCPPRRRRASRCSPRSAG